MNLSWPSENIRDGFNRASIAAIGRPVEFFYVYSSYACPICDLDPITNTSVDSFCPVCSGSHWIELISGVSISGHVTWKYSEALNWYAGGQQMDGDATIRINYSPSVYEIVDKTKYMIVDSREMQIKRLNLRGAPEYNRIVISVLEKEKP